MVQILDRRGYNIYLGGVTFSAVRFMPRLSAFNDIYYPKCGWLVASVLMLR